MSEVTPGLQDGSPPVANLGAAWARKKWNAFNLQESKERIAQLDSGSFVIDRLIPTRSLSIIVGDSGLGKSPLLYQAAMSVAHGIPFLCFPVSMGRVLYLDYENGLQGVGGVTAQLSRYLGVANEEPDNLLRWNFNDSPPNWESSKLREMVGDLRPDWVIVDPLSGFDLSIEAKTENVTRVFQTFRKIGQEFGAAFTGIHHLRKPSSDPTYTGPELEENAHVWLKQARGAGQLINGSDVRIGIDRPRARSGVDSNGHLVLAGFARISGNIGPIHIERVIDEQGEPLGYREMIGTKLLANSAQEKSFDDLPGSFTFTEAKHIYGRADQATTDFLKKCIAAGILRREQRTYMKVIANKPPHPPEWAE